MLELLLVLRSSTSESCDLASFGPLTDIHRPALVLLYGQLEGHSSVRGQCRLAAPASGIRHPHAGMMRFVSESSYTQ